LLISHSIFLKRHIFRLTLYVRRPPFHFCSFSCLLSPVGFAYSRALGLCHIFCDSCVTWICLLLFGCLCVSLGWVHSLFGLGHVQTLPYSDVTWPWPITFSHTGSYASHLCPCVNSTYVCASFPLLYLCVCSPRPTFVRTLVPLPSHTIDSYSRRRCRYHTTPLPRTLVVGAVTTPHH